MSYAVRAWRDGTGATGITIGHVEAAGDNNYVAEITLHNAEIDPFIADCRAAQDRSRAATAPLHEAMPGPYDRWPDRTEMGGAAASQCTPEAPPSS
jgi:hypothetical protein